MLTYDTTTGALTTNGTYTYKPPSQKDIPIDLRISLLENVINPFGVLSSKAAGEPPICLAISVYTAVRNAIGSARQDANFGSKPTWVDIPPPMTIDVIQQACGVTVSQLVI